MNAYDHKAPCASQAQHQALYLRLIGRGPGGQNQDFIAQMLASHMAGKGALPQRLGLDEVSFSKMLAWHFPHFSLGDFVTGESELLLRAEELFDVRNLLLDHRQHRSPSEYWIATILATGCMAPDHLWSDLGLFSRQYLTQMMELNFPELAGRNTKNMKWKKFLYKQLCAQEGIYICRAPSCELCADYTKCFIEEA